MVLSADLVAHLIQFWVLLSWKICLRTASRYALLVIVFMNNRGDRVVNVTTTTPAAPAATTAPADPAAIAPASASLAVLATSQNRGEFNNSKSP